MNGAVTLSLWLPVSRPNFFNNAEDAWLDKRSAPTAPGRSGAFVTCSSKRVNEDNDYVPLVLTSVLRRLLEVLPRSFGYGADGLCGYRGDAEPRKRPVNVTMGLDLLRSPSEPNTVPMSRPGETPRRRFWHEANDPLVAAGVTSVTLFVDENGWYVFTAEGGTDRSRVRDALMHHIKEIFGGDLNVHDLPTRTAGGRRDDPGSRSLKAYNGLRDNPGHRPGRDEDEEEDVPITEPRGALAFSQLNTIIEGLWNDTLYPAVFLEDHEFMDAFKAGQESEDFPRTLGDVVEWLTTDIDAADTRGQILTLHHFLTMSGGGSLLRMNAALDSARRRLLSEMTQYLHRRTPVAQLKLSSNRRERRPELAVGATELQLKGYATLFSAKLPLFVSLKEMLRRAERHVKWGVDEAALDPARMATEPELRIQLHRLEGQLEHWDALLDDLDKGVQGLVNTIARAWQDEMLYQQQQTRADQEALAEIERGRRSRPASSVGGQVLYGIITLILGIVGLVIAVGSDGFTKVADPDRSWWQRLWLLSPIWGGLLLGLVVSGIWALIRARGEKLGRQGIYAYEFSFRLDEEVHPVRLHNHVGATRHREIERHPGMRRVLRRVRAVNRGISRIERISPDETILKIHTVLTFRIRRLRYARFEVINEIQVNKAAREVRRHLVQTRTFGESPEPLTDAQLTALLRLILGDVLNEIAKDVTPAEVEELLGEVLPTPAEVAAARVA